MAASTAPNLGLVYDFDDHENGWGDNGFQPNMLLLDAIVFLSVKSAAIATPPGSPAAGDRYVVAASPTGAWSGHAKDLAIYRNGAWAFYTPKLGWRAWNENTSSFIYYTGSVWAAEPSTGGSVVNIDDLGDVTITTPVSGNVLSYNGSAWINSVPATGETPPTEASIGLNAWVNQGSATVADNAAGVSIFQVNSGSNDVFAARVMNAPSTPYLIKAKLALTTGVVSGIISVGLLFYDGTNKMQMIRIIDTSNSVPNIYVSSYATPTTFNVNHFGGQIFAAPIQEVAIGDDGTNAYFQISNDGVNYVTVYTVAKASGYLGGSGYTKVGFGVAANGATAFGTVLRWRV